MHYQLKVQNGNVIDIDLKEKEVRSAALLVTLLEIGRVVTLPNDIIELCKLTAIMSGIEEWDSLLKMGPLEAGDSRSTYKNTYFYKHISNADKCYLQKLKLIFGNDHAPKATWILTDLGNKVAEKLSLIHGNTGKLIHLTEKSLEWLAEDESSQVRTAEFRIWKNKTSTIKVEKYLPNDPTVGLPKINLEFTFPMGDSMFYTTLNSNKSCTFNIHSWEHKDEIVKMMEFLLEATKDVLEQ